MLDSKNSFFQLRIKRIADLIFASLLLVVAWPLFVVIVMAIKLESQGPVFFNQIRIGKNLKPFLCYKFRSMYHQNHDGIHEEFIRELMTKNEKQKLISTKIYKMTNDRRITRVGRLIRKFSLDELPQIFNVLRGEMSMIGPRPAIGYEIKFHDENMLRRFTSLPGITGYWQVHGRYSVDYKEMVSMDLFYVDNWTLWLDLKILLKTIPVVFKLNEAF